MKKFILLLVLFISVNTAFGQQPTYPPLFAGYVYGDSLWHIDTATWLPTQDFQLVGSLGQDVLAINGMAVQLCTGDVYVVYQQNAVTGRILGILDPYTGLIDSIGNMGTNVSGIAFLNDAILMAVTGDGGTPSETMFLVDQATGVLNQLEFAGVGGLGTDGEAIAACTDNGLVYRWSGRNTANVMQSWDDNGLIQTLTISGFDWDEIFSAVYVGDGQFLAANIDQEYVLIDTTGFALPPIGVTHEYQKGIAFPSRYIWFDSANSDTICPFVDSTLLVATSGADAYQWYLNGSPLAGAIADTLIATSAGTYKCEITRDTCILFSDDTLNVYMHSVTPAIVAPTSPEFCAGDGVLMTGSITADSSQWWFGGAVVSIDTFYMASVSGVYEYRLYDSTGCFDFIQLNVLEIPLPSVVANADQLSYCEGDMTTLTGAGADSYVWDNGVIDGVAFNQPVGPPVMYHLTGTDTITGCTNLDSILVNVFPNPTASGTSTDEILGTDGTIDGTFTGAPVLTFDWDNDGTGDFDDPEDLTGLTAGTYTVVVMDGNGCTATTTVIVGSQVGLNEFGMDASLSIYPNPNNGVFTVALANMTSENLTLQVINVAGQIVFEADASSKLVDVNISEFGNGTYTLRITDGIHNATEQIIVGH
jgi:hypothetical protein